MSDRLSPHFTLEEMTRSQTAARLGFYNQPNPATLSNLSFLCNEILEPYRVDVGKPIIVSSGFRCNELNKYIGGSFTSVHPLGLACDHTTIGLTLHAAMHWWLSHLEIPWDQVIYEYGKWIHIGGSLTNEPRRQALMIFKGSGYLKYDPKLISNCGTRLIGRK